MIKVSIIGLGWLGLPLAQSLLAQGYAVKGTATSPEKVDALRREGLDTYWLKFSPHPEGLDFQSVFDADILVVNIPPRTRTLPATFHPEQVKFIKAMAAQRGVKKLIYTSATSVYPDLNQEAKESDPLDMQNTGNPGLLQAEQLLWLDRSYALTIIRFGGLMGGERIPGKYFASKADVVGDTPVNFIHQADAVGVVEWVIRQQLWDEVYNAVSPMHPQRKSIYEKNAVDYGFTLPLSYAPEGATPYKVISPDKLLDTGYQFRYADPLDYVYG